MQYRDLGRTGIRVSVIGFGGWAIGGTAEASGTPLGWGQTFDDESLATIRRARELCVTFFDTADSYGFGRSESLLGIVLSRYRHEIVITRASLSASRDRLKGKCAVIVYHRSGVQVFGCSGVQEGAGFVRILNT